MGKLGVLGGTSLLKSDMFSALKPKTVNTPHGDAIVYTDPSGSRPIIFVQRHQGVGADGKTQYRPPHLVNFRANLAAMVQEGVDTIVAVCCVGSLSEDIPIGTVVIPDDFFYLFGPSVSYYDDARAHIVPGFDDKLRGKLIEALTEESILGFRNGGAVYVQTVGPRFETKAEVRFLSTLGDIIGMTGATEATIAKELEVPYAILAMVDNMANGLAGSDLTKEQFHANVAKNLGVVERCVATVLEKLTPKHM
ncbi:putative 6-oxopurine nucleoside phosphorylase [Gracilariopsis chorda]|uniref:Putative 6-oxopurine nucleoside phosphorylase n=1 Tax=Gracilariopsis chorda TaxID=448386 RepID=A0A2V3J076_9FLOR|nr:putative 6-oxopurine nucleoside phosphorylase [Gracilariopsis chorda]|eukprot:PXF47804.1 putative 6-oxopurine nucleoside phosphorylase [Gracilariopsis chorda]